eukprot:3396790-Rhodomonas_salina.1
MCWVNGHAAGRRGRPPRRREATKWGHWGVVVKVPMGGQDRQHYVVGSARVRRGWSRVPCYQQRRPAARLEERPRSELTL